MQREPTTIDQGGLPSKREILRAAHAEQLHYSQSVRWARRRRRPPSKAVLISMAVLLLIGVLWLSIERPWI